MKVVLLGTGGYHPTDDRHTMCVMIPESGIVFDAGTGIYRAGRFVKTTSLDLFLSHTHLDHVEGLTYLVDVIRRHSLQRITIHALGKKLAALNEHLFSPELFPVKPAFDYQPLTDGLTLASGAEVEHFLLEHPGGAVGYRVNWPSRSMAYVTDTTAKPDAEYVERIRNVNLLIHECFLPDSQAQWAAKTGHSYTTAVASVAARANVAKLVLVHISPELTGDDPLDLCAARVIFPNTHQGRDLMEVEF